MNKQPRNLSFHYLAELEKSAMITPPYWFKRPRVGVVGVFWSNLARKDRARWLEVLLRSGTYLLIATTLLVVVLSKYSRSHSDLKGVSITLAALLIYSLVLEFLSRFKRVLYDKPAFRVIRLGATVAAITSLIFFSSPYQNSFWFFYSLPLLQGTLYLRPPSLYFGFTAVVASYWTISVLSASLVSHPLDPSSLVMNTLALLSQQFIFLLLLGSSRGRQRLEYEELEALQKTALEISAQLKPELLLKTVINRAITLLRATGGGIYLADKSRKELVVVADHPTKHSIVGHRLRIGEGMAGRVFESGKPLVVDDYSLWEHRSSSLEPDLFRAVVEVPLGVPPHVLGVLYVSDHDEGRFFSDRDVKLLDLLASHAAIALTNAKVFEDETKNLRKLEMLNRVNEQIQTTQSVGDILQIALQEALRAVRTTEGSIMLVNRDTGKLEIVAWIAESSFLPNRLHPSFRLDEGIAGRVAQTGKPYKCDDVSSDSTFVISPVDRPNRSLLSIPIIYYGRVLAVLNADHDAPSFFHEDDIDLLSVLAGHVALALESQRLRDVGLFLSTLSLKDLCSKIVESACLLTGTETSTIFLLGDEGLTRAASHPPGAEAADPRPDGLTMSVIRSGESVQIEDVQSDPRVQSPIKSAGVRSLLCVPLKVRTGYQELPVKTIGTLIVRSNVCRTFVGRDEELLRGLANQAAIAIENSRIRSALEEHSNFRESLLENAFDAIIAIDPEGHVREFNAAAQRILGYSREEAIGKPVEIFYCDKAAAKEVKTLLLEPLNRGKIINHRSAVKDRNGLRISIRISASLLPEGSVGFFRDLREIESAHEHIARLQQLLAAIQTITNGLDLDSVMVMSAQRAIDTLGADLATLHCFDDDRGEWVRPGVRCDRNGYSFIEAPPSSGENHNNLSDKDSESKEARVSFPGIAPSSSDPKHIPREGKFILDIPLQISERMLGRMQFHYRPASSLGDEDRAILSIFSSAVAGAMYNALLYREASQRADQLQVLYQSSLGLTADSSVEAVLRNIVDKGRELTHAKYGALGIVGSEGRLETFVTSGLDQAETTEIESQPIGRGILGHLLNFGESLNLRDVTQHPLFTGWPDHHPTIKSFLGVPITLRGKAIGNLYTANKLSGEVFNPDDEISLNTLAAQAALLIERSREQEETSAFRTINIAFVILSYWGHLVRQKSFALIEDINNLGKVLPAGLYENFLENMNSSVRELDQARKTLQAEVEKGFGEEIDLGELVEKIARDRSVNRQMTLDLILDVEEPCPVKGNRLLLEFALSMLMENAIEAIQIKGVPGKLQISCCCDSTWNLVKIVDNGSGIPQEVQRALYRTPIKSLRGLGHGAVAAGMIFKAHRGGIRILATGPEGSEILFWIPLLETDSLSVS